MKKITVYVLSGLVLSVLLSSCKALFYTPNRNPVPLFKNKGDFFVDASTNFVKKADLTAGFAVLNGLGVYAGYSGAYAWEDHEDSASNTSYRKKYNGQMYNFGLGYFMSEKQSEQLRFEIYADYGMGTYRNKITGTINEHFNGTYRRIGIMPNIGWSHPRNKIAVAYTLRYSIITFENPEISNVNFWREDIARLNHRPNYRLLEHGITFRAGGENVKFQFQAALYHNLDAQDIDKTNAIPTFNASVMFGMFFSTNFLGRD